MTACAYCFEEKKLCRSHAIPNAYFRALKTNGKGLFYQSNEADNHVLQTSGDCLLLCAECESEFNFKYDLPLIDTLDSLREKTEASAKDIRLIANCLLSIIWRASKSTSDFYGNFNLTKKKEDYIRGLFEDQTRAKYSHFSMRIRLLKDNHSRLSSEEIKIILSPRLYLRSNKSQNTFMTVTMLFGGYYMEFVFPSYPRKFRLKNNYVKWVTKRTTLHFADIIDIPELRKEMPHMILKDYQGRTSKAFQKMVEKY